MRLPSLSLGGMIDVLIVIVTYLLISFTATGECGCHKPIRLPTGAENVLEIIEAPIVAVTPLQILVDGTPAGVPADLTRGRVARIDELFSILTRRRELWKELHPGMEYPGVVVLEIDLDVPADLVKSVVSTAASSGHPQLSFLVEARPTSSTAL